MDGNRNLIFSLYIDISDEDLEKDLGPFPGELIERTIVVKNSYQEYYTRLIDNHQAYADTIHADYIAYGDDDRWRSFYKEWKTKYPLIPKYHIINFYKFYLLEEMTTVYDKVLYIDLDVAFNTDKNFFDTMKDGLNLFVKDLKETMSNIIGNNLYNLHRRAPTAKWFLVRAMCMEMFIPYTDQILNSGIMAADRKTMEQLDYTNSLAECLEIISDLKNDTNSMFTKKIQDTFDWNNEAIATYLAFKNNVPLVNTDGPWNFHVRRIDRRGFDLSEKYIIHFIIKNFNWYFGEADGD